MARKKLTKKATQTGSTKKRQPKKNMSVMQTLKQLPRQIKNELMGLKRKARKLAAALRKVRKQKKKVDTALSKKSTPKKIAAAKKVATQVTRVLAESTRELDKTNELMDFLREKQALIIELTQPMTVEKVKKETVKQVKPKKQTAKKLKPLTPAGSIREILKTDDLENPAVTPELDDSFNR
jgi:cysteinyl-tRNA synthetase